MPRSIRFRVTATAIVLSAVLLVVVAVLMISVLRSQLTDNLDEGIDQRADTIAVVLSDVIPDQLTIDEDVLVQVVDADEDVLISSSNLTGAAPIAPLQPGRRTIENVPNRTEIFRVLTRPIQTSAGPAILLLGVNYDDVTDPVAILSRLLSVAVPTVVLLLGALTWWLTGRTLRPVARIRTELAAISATNLGGRVPEPGTGDEIDRLARTTNETLDRLAAAVRSQQRFVSDASHELRSPLTRIRGELELSLAHPAESDRGTTERSVLEETVGMQHLVEDLLHLARTDAGAPDAAFVAVDLDDIVLREVRALADRGTVRIDVSGVSAAQVDGDAGQLARALKNLLDNAARHAVSAVTVTLAELDGTARLTVSDDGAGVPAAQRERIFDRFTRLDEARSRDAGGSGLGLAITRDIVHRHGGVIALADDHASTFVIDLPART